MEIKVSTTIDAPIDQVWETLAGDFANGANWMSQVPVSYPIPGEAPEGMNVAGRICELTDKGSKGLIAEETIIACDVQNHRLVVDVVTKNTPPGFPVKSSQTTFELEKLAFGQTRATVIALPRLNILGSVLKPILKGALAKSFDQILSDLKSHSEDSKMAVAA